MATTNHERVSKAMELLRAGLASFVHCKITAKVKAGAALRDVVRRCAGDSRQSNKSIGDWDVAALLKLMSYAWNDVFRESLGLAERGLVSELRDWRNKWAHQERFVSDDVYRVMDSVQRLLAAINAPQVNEVARIKRELRRLEGDEKASGGNWRRPEDQEEEPRQARQERTRASSRPDLSNEKVPNSSTSQADSIRHHALRHYVEPWRNTKEQRLSIRAGDVQRELNLHGVAPNVCNALGGRKFLELADLKLIVHTKPCPSTTTVFFYERAQ